MKGKIKSILGYMLYFFFIIFCFRVHYHYYHKYIVADWHTLMPIFTTTNVVYYLVNMFINIFFGMLFCVPYIITLRKTSGKVKFDWIRCLSLGIPALAMSLGLSGYFPRIKNDFLRSYIHPEYTGWLAIGFPRYYFNWLLGAVIVFSFEKKS